MSAPAFSFVGLEPWSGEGGLIECQAEVGLLDLHNFANFEGFEFRADGTLLLHWHHDDAAFGPSRPHQVTMRFIDVRDLEARQAEDWDIRCADDTHAWTFWPRGAGRADLLFEVGDSEVKFSASGAELLLVETDEAPVWPNG